MRKLLVGIFCFGIFAIDAFPAGQVDAAQLIASALTGQVGDNAIKEAEAEKGCAVNKIDDKVILYSCANGKTFIKISNTLSSQDGLYMLMSDGKKVKILNDLSR